MSALDLRSVRLSGVAETLLQNPSKLPTENP